MSKQVTVSKSSAKQAIAVTKPVAAKLAYHLKDSCRPGHGALLQAHTEAFLRLSGLVNGGRVPTTLAQTVLGKSAVAWHTKKGNFSITAQGLGLSETGEFAFGVRGVNEEFCAAYTAVMAEGTLQPSVGVKAEFAIGKLA